MVKGIKLTQDKAALVDDEDFEELNKFCWCVSNTRKTSYAKRWGGNNTPIFMHRVIMGSPNRSEIDHIDGNGLNNQKSNLRFVTHRQNLLNHHRRKSSIYPGVSWDKSKKKWRSDICIDGRHKYLGAFATEVQAFEKYSHALIEVGDDGQMPESLSA